jgi:hypothetical protein
MPVVPQKSNQGKGNSNSKQTKASSNKPSIPEKTKGIIIVFIAIIFIVGYIEYKDSKQKDEEFKKAQLAIQQKLIADQLRAESIEKARQDSIKNEHIKIETIQLGHNLINAFGKEYIKQVTPSSGENLTSQIDTIQSTYNYSTKTLTLIFSLHWRGYIGAITIFEDYKKDLEYKGRLIIYEDKQREFQAIYKNSNLTTAENNSDFVKKLGDKTLEKVIESAIQSTTSSN